MPIIPSLTSFSASTLAQSAQVNSNFTTIQSYVNTYGVFKDVAAQVITKSLTLTPDAGVALTVTTGGITITAGGLTVTAGGATITAGNVAVTAGNLTFGAASAKIIPGATSLLFRDTGDANTNLSITDAGAMTVRAGLTVSGSGITVTGNSTITGTLGSITTLTANIFAGGAASSKLLIGSSDLLIRNSADNATIVTIDSNSVTLASGKAFTTGGGSTGTVTTAANNVKLTPASGGNCYIGFEGAMATNATSQFPIMPTCAGIPSGAALAGSFVFDTTNRKFNVNTGSGWYAVTLT